MAGHKYNPKMAGFLLSPLRKFILKPKKILNELNILKTDVWADIGCGSGLFTILLAQMINKVYAMDISNEMLKMLKETLKKQKISNVEIMQSSETKVPLKNESIDGILLAFVAHELDEPEILVNEFFRSLKSGGRLIIIEHAIDGSIMGPPRSHRLAQEQMDDWALKVGFKKGKALQGSKSIVVWEYIKS
jgi:ubiquinone/menaquinone biosynthesis C-methylase UbiE